MLNFSFIQHSKYIVFFDCLFIVNRSVTFFIFLNIQLLDELSEVDISSCFRRAFCNFWNQIRPLGFCSSRSSIVCFNILQYNLYLSLVDNQLSRLVDKLIVLSRTTSGFDINTFVTGSISAGVGNARHDIIFILFREYRFFGISTKVTVYIQASIAVKGFGRDCLSVIDLLIAKEFGKQSSLFQIDIFFNGITSIVRCCRSCGNISPIVTCILNCGKLFSCRISFIQYSIFNNELFCGNCFTIIGYGKSRSLIITIVSVEARESKFQSLSIKIARNYIQSTSLSCNSIVRS